MTWNKCIASRTYDILQYFPVGVFVLRRDYTVIFWNNCLEEWTGITSDEISGTNLFERFSNLDTPMYKGPR
jgi:PAS domain S-box-containing protein